MPSISLVVAAYNEEAALRSTVERCLAVLRQVSGDCELIVLDDASRDRTPEIAAQLAREHPGIVRIVTHEKNLGIAATFEDLFRAATKEFVFDVPGDGEYPPEALLEIVPLLADHDIVVCRRIAKRYTPYRRLVSNLYRLLPRVLFGVELHDPGSTKCRRRTTITDIPLTSRGVFCEAERLIRAHRRGCRIGVVDIVPETRQGGEPRGARPRYVFEAARDLVALWFRLVVLRQKP
jgi:glycosyltransferase involved in cell wall biosynthesis